MSRQLGLIITKGKDFVFSRENLHGACPELVEWVQGDIKTNHFIWTTLPSNPFRSAYGR